MARLIPNAERLRRARDLVQQARDLPVPSEFGKNDLAYIAQVKDLLRQARDLIKFIPQMPSAADEIKEDVQRIYQEIQLAEINILH